MFHAQHRPPILGVNALLPQLLLWGLTLLLPKLQSIVSDLCNKFLSSQGDQANPAHKQEIETAKPQVNQQARLGVNWGPHMRMSEQSKPCTLR